MCYQMCSNDIFVDLQPFGCKLKGRIFDSRFGRFGWMWGVDERPSALPSVPMGTSLTHIVYLLPFLSYLVIPKAFASVRPCVQPGYDGNYRSRSYCFVERQKLSWCVNELFLFFGHDALLTFPGLKFFLHSLMFFVHSGWLYPPKYRLPKIGNCIGVKPFVRLRLVGMDAWHKGFAMK